MPLYKKALLLSLFLIFQSGASVIGAAVILDNKYSEVIQQGVTIKGIQVGGLNLAEAAAKLENTVPRSLGNTFVISNEEKSCSINLSDIDGSYDYLSTAGEALAYGKESNTLNQLMSDLRLRAKPVDMEVKITFNDEKLADRIKNIQRTWETPPKNAEIILLNDKAVIVPEKKVTTLILKKLWGSPAWRWPGEVYPLTRPAASWNQGLLPPRWKGATRYCLNTLLTLMTAPGTGYIILPWPVLR